MKAPEAPQAPQKGTLLRPAFAYTKRIGSGLFWGILYLLFGAWAVASEGGSFKELWVQVVAVAASGLGFAVGFFGYDPVPGNAPAEGGVWHDTHLPLHGLDGQTPAETLSQAGSAATEAGSGLLHAITHIAQDALDAIEDFLQEMKD